MLEGYKSDLDLVQGEMKKENQLIKRVLAEEKKITKEMLDDLLLKVKEQKEKTLRPILDKINELNSKLNILKGKFEGDRVKEGKGIKVTINFLENVFLDKPVKVQMKVWLEQQVDYDIKKNMMFYQTQSIADYMNTKEVRTKLEQRLPFEIFVDEVFFVAKNYQYMLQDNNA